MKHERCAWATHVEDIEYHDHEWCIPSHDDSYLFEMLVLEGMQAGLSWITILRKRKNFQVAFDHFDIEKICKYNETNIQELMQNKGIIRNRLKIQSVIKNAKAFKEIQHEFGSFDAYIWGFTKGESIDHKLERIEDMPAYDALSDTISKDLKKRGFSFVGSTIIYSYLQAIGIINDHVVSCPYHDIKKAIQETLNLHKNH